MTATFYVGDACDCVEGCQLADRFTPATRELMVFTKSAKRYFDLDAVREPNAQAQAITKLEGRSVAPITGARGDDGKVFGVNNPAGSPPLDWWQIPSPKSQPVTEYEGEPMTATFYVGDAIETMNKLPEKSVDLVLTSPPFLALRSYLPADHPDKALEGGSQATPGLFIDWLIDVVEACDRVLAPHGSLCIELGDTYAGSGGAGGDYAEDGLRAGQPKFRQDGGRYVDGYSGGSKGHNVDASNGAFEMRPFRGNKGWPLAKSLSLIPELFRLTLVYGFNPLTGRQTERWRLRNVVRWVRPNPPVGALGDKFRPATSELMVFCKSAKRYFDLDAVREPHKAEDRPIVQRGEFHQRDTRSRADDGAIRGPQHAAGAPPLDWWNIPPGGYEGAHYAVFPPELCIKPIKAMCPEKVCRVCGEPSRRIVEGTRYVAGEIVTTDFVTAKGEERLNQHGRKESKARPGANGQNTFTDYVTLGFSDCGHDDWRPGRVLDPFGGSGTTALVATGHGRDCILIDLDGRNYELALDRVGPLVLSKGEAA